LLNVFPWCRRPTIITKSQLKVRGGHVNSLLNASGWIAIGLIYTFFIKDAGDSFFIGQALHNSEKYSKYKKSED
jgi:hypothetical protein